MTAREREHLAIAAAVKHAVDPNRPISLTRHGIASCAAATTVVLMDARHPNHLHVCERLGVPPLDR